MDGSAMSASSTARKLIGYAYGLYNPEYIHLTRGEAQSIVNALEQYAGICEMYDKWATWAKTADQYNAVAGVHNLLDELKKLIYPTEEEK